MKSKESKILINNLRGSIRDLVIDITIHLANIKHDDKGLKHLTHKEYKQVIQLESMRSALMLADPKQTKKDELFKNSLPF